MKLLYLMGLHEHPVDWSNRKNLFKAPLQDHYVFGSHTFYKGYKHLLDTKAILMTRDLRDTAVSLAFYMMKIKDHPYHPYFMKLKSFDERLACAISGIQDCRIGQEPFYSLAERHANTAEWSYHPLVHTTKFEDLVGSKGGGNDTQQRWEIIKICDHINKPVNTKLLDHCQKLLWGKKTKYGSNFRKGVIGNWKQHFKESHKRLAKKLFGDVLMNEGYERGFSW